MKNRTAEYSKDFNNTNDTKCEKLLFDNNSYAIVRKITETKVQIGLVTQNKNNTNLIK
jgi:hypothetical protein